MGRRFASTSESTQEKAQEKAKEAFAAAQKGFAKAAEAAKKVTGGLGERAGTLLGCMYSPLFCCFRFTNTFLFIPKSSCANL